MVLSESDDVRDARDLDLLELHRDEKAGAAKQVHVEPLIFVDRQKTVEDVDGEEEGFLATV